MPGGSAGVSNGVGEPTLLVTGLLEPLVELGQRRASRHVCTPFVDVLGYRPELLYHRLLRCSFIGIHPFYARHAGTTTFTSYIVSIVKSVLTTERTVVQYI